MHVNLK